MASVEKPRLKANVLQADTPAAVAAYVDSEVAHRAVYRSEGTAAQRSDLNRCICIARHTLPNIRGRKAGTPLSPFPFPDTGAADAPPLLFITRTKSIGENARGAGTPRRGGAAERRDFFGAFLGTKMFAPPCKWCKKAPNVPPLRAGRTHHQNLKSIQYRSTALFCNLAQSCCMHTPPHFSGWVRLEKAHPAPHGACLGLEALHTQDL